MQNKLTYRGEIVGKGDIVIDGDGEEGVIVDINFKKKVVSLYGDGEGWYVSEKYDNAGELKFI